MGTQKGFAVFGLNTIDGEVNSMIPNVGQVMAGVTIGPDETSFIVVLSKETSDLLRLWLLIRSLKHPPGVCVAGDLQGTNRQK